MSIYVVAGPRKEDYLRMQAKRIVDMDQCMYLAKSNLDELHDYKAVAKILDLPALTLLLHNRPRDSTASAIAIFLQDLDYETIDLKNFIKAALSCHKYFADTYIGMSNCSLISMFESDKVTRINADKDNICTWQSCVYETRSEQNNSIYEYLKREQEASTK